MLLWTLLCLFFTSLHYFLFMLLVLLLLLVLLQFLFILSMLLFLLVLLLLFSVPPLDVTHATAPAICFPTGPAAPMLCRNKLSTELTDYGLIIIFIYNLLSIIT